MRSLEEYENRYRNATLSRDGSGVLEVVLHDGEGGPLKWSESAHRELPILWADIAADPENRVVILTGTGDVFCAELDWAVWQDMDPSAMWDKLFVEGKRLLENILSIEVPVIGAVNGPAGIHAEMIGLSDIVLASDNATFSDKSHFQGGLPAADGVHIYWPMVLGPSRARYFLLTGQEIGASEALGLGFVHEVLPPERLMDRARELAADLASKTTLNLRGTRAAIVHDIRRRFVDQLGFGLALEARAAVTDWGMPSSKDWTGREHIARES
jgi:enoyl-CoA hydratase/carnithine racemase